VALTFTSHTGSADLFGIHILFFMSFYRLLMCLRFEMSRYLWSEEVIGGHIHPWSRLSHYKVIDSLSAMVHTMNFVCQSVFQISQLLTWYLKGLQQLYVRHELLCHLFNS